MSRFLRPGDLVTVDGRSLAVRPFWTRPSSRGFTRSLSDLVTFEHGTLGIVVATVMMGEIVDDIAIIFDGRIVWRAAVDAVRVI